MKRTLKSVREECRKELSKQFEQKYQDKVKYLENGLKNLDELFRKTRQENIELKKRNQELESKLEQLEDWNTRLQEFVNMSDDEREKAIKIYRQEMKNKQMFNDVMTMANPYFQILAGLC